RNRRVRVLLVAYLRRYDAWRRRRARVGGVVHVAVVDVGLGDRVIPGARRRLTRDEIGQRAALRRGVEAQPAQQVGQKRPRQRHVPVVGDGEVVLDDVTHVGSRD